MRPPEICRSRWPAHRARLLRRPGRNDSWSPTSPLPTGLQVMSTTLAPRMAPARRNAPVIQSGFDLERARYQRIHRRFPPSSAEKPAFWRSSLLAGRSGDWNSSKRPPGLREFEPDRQAFQPVDEQGLGHLRLASEFDRFQPRQKLLVQYAHFHLGEVLAQTEGARHSRTQAACSACGPREKRYGSSNTASSRLPDR